MLRRVRTALSVLALAIGGLAVAMPAHAQERVKAGVLTCNVSSGWGFIFGSSRDLKCNFSAETKTDEHYEGAVTKVGADIGYYQAGVIVWLVFAPTSHLASGALTGTYVGVTGGASVGVGLGAHVLVGGSDKTISLQPVSFEGMQGLNVAAGIEGLTLKHAP